MTANQPANRNNQVKILAAVGGAILLLCCCGVAAVLVVGNYQFLRTRLSAQPTAPNTPVRSIAEALETQAPTFEPLPSETPMEGPTSTVSAPVPSATPVSPVLLTLWTSQESDAIYKQIATYQENNPGVTISVTVVDQNKIIDLWKNSVIDGTAPDLMLADNANLWKLVSAKTVASLDEDLQSKMEAYTKLALTGMTIGGKLYGIPLSFELAGLYYNTTLVENPPAKITDLSLLYRTGSKFGMVKSPYYMMGFITAYGGTIADKNGRCAATQANFEDALYLMRQIRKYGSFLADDPTTIREKFKTGGLAMILDDSAELPEFVQALGNDVASLPIPGANNPASPFLQQTGFYFNPKSQNTQVATDLALTLSNAQAQTAYLEDYWIPTRSDVEVKNPAIKGFVDGAQTGYPIPQAAWFSNWEAPFQNMINQVLNNQFEIPDAIRLACKNMDTLNNK
jgi:arabinogalactan oligomer/maltooligosaccharide transport system substrate-binding protein